MKTILIFALSLYCLQISAQVVVSPETCERIFQKAKTAEKNGNYREAINNFNAVIECNPARKREINSLVLDIFGKIEAQRNVAVKAKTELQIEKKKVETERDKARKAQEEALRQAYRAEQASMSNYNVSLALKTLQTNPTLALRIAERNYNLHPKESAAEAAYFRLLGDTSLRFYRQDITMPGAVSCMAINVDGTLGVAGLNTGQLVLWRPKSPAAIEILHNFRSEVVSVSFSPNGRYLIVGASQIVFIWEMTNLNSPLYKFETIKSPIVSVGFSPDNKFFFYACNNGILEIHPTERPEELTYSFSYEKGIRANVSISPDGKKILAASTDKNLLLWNFDQPNEAPIVLTGHKKHILKALFSPDSREIFSSDENGLIFQWRLSEPKVPVRTLVGGQDKVFDIAIHPSGKTFISVGEDKTVKLWDMEQGRVSYIYRGNTGITRACFFEPASGYFWSGCDDGTIRQWPSEARLPTLQSMKHHSGDITDIQAVPKSEWIYSSATDGKVFRWKENGDEQVDSLQAHDLAISDMILSTDGKTLFTAALDSLLKIWTTEPNLRLKQTPVALPFIIRNMALSTSGALLATASRDSVVRVWKTNQLQTPMLSLKGYNGQILSISFAPDEQSLFTGGEDGIIRQWALTPPHGTVLRSWVGHSTDVRSIYLTKDAKRLYSLADGNSIRIWDLENPQSPVQVFNLPKLRDKSYFLDFSPDESEFATIVASEVTLPPVGVFTKTGSTEPYWTYFGDTSGVLAVKYSPNGEFLYFGFWEGRIEKRGTPGWFVRNQVASVSLETLLQNGFQIDTNTLFLDKNPAFLPAIAAYFYQVGLYDASKTAWEKVIQNDPSPSYFLGLYETEKRLSIDRTKEYLEMDSVTVRTFANHFKTNGEWTRAKVFFEKLRETTKDASEAGKLAAEIYEVCLRGNIPVDRDQLFNFSAKLPYQWIIYMLLDATHGTWSYSQEIVNFKEVLAIIDKMKVIDPNHEENHYSGFCHRGIGQYYYNRNDYTNALLHLRECLRYDPENEWANIRIPLILLFLKQFDEAKKEYQTLIGRFSGEDREYFKESFLSDLDDAIHFGRFNPEQRKIADEIIAWLKAN